MAILLRLNLFDRANKNIVNMWFSGSLQLCGKSHHFPARIIKWIVFHSLLWFCYFWNNWNNYLTIEVIKVCCFSLPTFPYTKYGQNICFRKPCRINCKKSANRINACTYMVRFPPDFSVYSSCNAFLTKILKSIIKKSFINYIKP
jgi:hypothetical protein